jgi:hypothetical protein
MMGRRIVAILGWGSLAFGLIQCQSTVYQPAFPAQASFRVHHHGVYSSKFAGEERETPGTVFESRYSYAVEKDGAGWLVRRKLDSLSARGYHKLSMPNELEKKVAVEIALDSARNPVRVSGYDSLHKVLGRIEQKEEYRKQLLAGSDSAFFKAWTRDWWRLLDFLPRGMEFKMGQGLPVEKANERLETFRIDSARYDAMRVRGTSGGLRKNCLEYTLYYHRTDSLPLLMEQFFFSNIDTRKYRKYSWKPGQVNGFLQFSVERETGLPCFHSRSEIGDMTLTYAQDKEDTSRVSIQLIRYEEDIFEH